MEVDRRIEKTVRIEKGNGIIRRGYISSVNIK